MASNLELWDGMAESGRAVKMPKEPEFVWVVGLINSVTRRKRKTVESENRRRLSWQEPTQFFASEHEAWAHVVARAEGRVAGAQKKLDRELSQLKKCQKRMEAARKADAQLLQAEHLL